MRTLPDIYDASTEINPVIEAWNHRQPYDPEGLHLHPIDWKKTLPFRALSWSTGEDDFEEHRDLLAAAFSSPYATTQHFYDVLESLPDGPAFDYTPHVLRRFSVLSASCVLLASSHPEYLRHPVASLHVWTITLRHNPDGTLWPLTLARWSEPETGIGDDGCAFITFIGWGTPSIEGASA